MIHPKLVLTSATCLFNVRAQNIKIRARSTYHSKGGYLIKARGVLVHPSYDANAGINDIAVISLASKLPENLVISLIPDYLTIGNDRNLYISGWGTTSLNNNNNEEDLHFGVVRKLNQASFRSALGNKFAETMLCARAVDGQVDTCKVRFLFT